MTTILKSAPIVQALAQDLRTQTAALVDKDVHPHLAIVLVGNHLESLKYIEIKNARAKEAGLITSLYHLEADATDEEIITALDFLSEDPEVHGVILQLPLPGDRTKDQVETIMSHIRLDKDVDGLQWLTHQHTLAHNDNFFVLQRNVVVI